MYIISDDVEKFESVEDEDGTREKWEDLEEDRALHVFRLHDEGEKDQGDPND